MNFWDSLPPDRRARGTMCVVGAIASLLWATMVGTAFAQSVELIPFETITVTTQQFLTGGKDGKPATIAGELRIPKSGSEKVAAVILMEGAGGIGSNIEQWVETLNDIGIASFLLDSYTGRGITDTSKLDILAQMVDAYRALGVLAARSNIDSKRIAILGISKGAMAALYSSNVRFRDMYGPPGVEFAAHIVLYGPCVRTYRDDAKVTGKPIRLFHGTADDVFSIERCREYVARLKQSSVDIQLTEFPDAHHAFTAVDAKTPVINSQALSTRNCRLEEGDNGQLLNSATAKPFAPTDACMQRGNTYAYNEAAATATTAAVKAFLTALK
jgi:dienelactone hydrolase